MLLATIGGTPTQKMNERMSSIINSKIKKICLSTAKYSAEVKKEAIRVQNQILYDGNPENFGRCIICDKHTSNRKDHYVSAITKKMPRSRDGYLLATNHPMNMVLCCKGGCNNEPKKMALLNTSPRHRAYYDYVLANCPLVPISVEDWKIWYDGYLQLAIEAGKLDKKLLGAYKGAADDAEGDV